MALTRRDHRGSDICWRLMKPLINSIVQDEELKSGQRFPDAIRAGGDIDLLSS